MSGARAGAVRAVVVLHIHGLERPRAAAPGASDHYPPYDLVRVRGADARDDTLRLVLAVAGFRPDQLEITVAGDQLSISGDQSGDGDVARFLHRGIAARRFRRVFRLAEDLEVTGADLDFGLLRIALAVGAAGRVSRSIAIGAGAPLDGRHGPSSS